MMVGYPMMIVSFVLWIGSLISLVPFSFLGKNG